MPNRKSSDIFNQDTIDAANQLNARSSSGFDIPQDTRSDAEKAAETFINSAPGILDAIDRYKEERKRREVEYRKSDDKPDGFHSDDPVSDADWFFDSDDNSNIDVPYEIDLGDKVDLSFQSSFLSEDDRLREVFSNNTKISDIVGEPVDNDDDGKVDYITGIYGDGTLVNFYDDNSDGQLDNFTARLSDGSQIAVADMDGDGIPDKKATLTPDGNATVLNLTPPKSSLSNNSQTTDLSETESQSYNVDLSGIPEGLLTGDYQSDRKNFLRNQMMKPGEDGFISEITPFDSKEDVKENDRNIYFTNGVLNKYDEARNTAQLIANTIDEPVSLVYYESAEQKEYTAALLLDSQKALDYRQGYNSSHTQMLEQSLFLDLANDKEVVVFAHSGGAASTHNAVMNLQNSLNDRGMGDRIVNLTIVNLGGFNPPATGWPSQIKVIDVDNQYDAISYLAGHGAMGSSVGNVSLDVHPVREYMEWINFLSQKDIDKQIFDTRMFPTFIPPEELRQR